MIARCFKLGGINKGNFFLSVLQIYKSKSKASVDSNLVVDDTLDSCLVATTLHEKKKYKEPFPGFFYKATNPIHGSAAPVEVLIS